LSKPDLALLARNSIEASFLAPSEQRRWFAAIDDAVAADQLPFR
jgi:adenosine deaminase